MELRFTSVAEGQPALARKLFAMLERIIPATYSLYRNEKPLAMGS